MYEDDDLYEVLQVHTSARPEVITAAYRRLLRIYHPDVNSSPDATGITARLNYAYEILGDPQRRASYDQERAYHAAASEPSGTYRASAPRENDPDPYRSSQDSPKPDRPINFRVPRFTWPLSVVLLIVALLVLRTVLAGNNLQDNFFEEVIPQSGLYSGRVHNTTYDTESTMLLKLNNNGGKLSGRIVVLSPLDGDGLIHGFVDELELEFNVKFALIAQSYSIDFAGRVLDRGDRIEGTYSVEPTKEVGKWSVSISPNADPDQGQVYVWGTELSETIGDVRPAGIFLLVYFDFVNLSERPMAVSDSDFELVDEEGSLHSISQQGTLGYVEGDFSRIYSNEQVSPGETLEVVEIFDLPRSVMQDRLTLKFNNEQVATFIVDPN